MKYRCSLCGRFVTQIKDAVGLPLSTGFPPDKPMTASTVPFAPFVCRNHRTPKVAFDRVEYLPIAFAFLGNKGGGE